MKGKVKRDGKYGSEERVDSKREGKRKEKKEVERKRFVA